MDGAIFGGEGHPQEREDAVEGAEITNQIRVVRYMEREMTARWDSDGVRKVWKKTGKIHKNNQEGYDLPLRRLAWPSTAKLTASGML